MRYFPLEHDRFEHQFGVRALDREDSIVEATERYDAEVALKRGLLQIDRDNYYQSLPNRESAQRSAMESLCSAASFVRADRNVRLNEFIESASCDPLLEIARHIQEDLVILSGDPRLGHPVIAGVVCFPSGWTIAEKIGRSVLQVHRPVPAYEPRLSKSTDQLLARLKPGRPVWRMNWGVRASDELDQSPKHLPKVRSAIGKLTPENVGAKCMFRVERQTLSRLDNVDGDILFTIHTHQTSLAQLNQRQRENLCGVLKTCPKKTLDYKGITPFKDLVCAYLGSDPTDDSV